MADNQTEVIKQEINKAINFLGQNKFTEAENTCLKIIGTHDNADAFHILSSIKIYQQEFKESIEYLFSSPALTDSKFTFLFLFIMEELPNRMFSA